MIICLRPALRQHRFDANLLERKEHRRWIMIHGLNKHTSPFLPGARFRSGANNWLRPYPLRFGMRCGTMGGSNGYVDGDLEVLAEGASGHTGLIDKNIEIGV